MVVQAFLLAIMPVVSLLFGQTKMFVLLQFDSCNEPNQPVPPDNPPPTKSISLQQDYSQLRESGVKIYSSEGYRDAECIIERDGKRF